MRTVMASLFGKLDIRLRETELPELKDDQILLKVVTNSLCPSTYKAAELGSDHLRVPDNIAEVPVVTGHELAGVIEQVGPKWQNRYHPGQHATIHSGLRVKGSEKAPGYSFEFFGGNALYAIIPGDYIEYDGVLTFDEDYFAFASLLEPLTCDIGAFHTLYHERMQEYPLYPGNKEGGTMALMASCGAMGLGCIDYAIHGPRRPKLLVVTDVNQERLDHAARLLTVEDARSNGVELHYVNTGACGDEYDALMGLTDHKGFDDTIVFALSAHVLELANRTLAYNGCMDFFAGPIDTEFSAAVNYYDIHYRKTHLVGNSGGNFDDLKEAMRGCQQGWLHPEYMVTHVLGLKEVPETLMNFPKVPGMKKLCYPHCDLPFMALEDFRKREDEDPVYRQIADILDGNKGVWCKEAEKVLLENKSIY